MPRTAKEEQINKFSVPVFTPGNYLMVDD